MSRETAEWLNRNVLVGYTDKRGNAWHYLESAQGDEPNHYTGPVPVADVQRRLFAWEPVVNMLVCPCGCGDVYKSVSRSDNRHRMGMFREGYEPHSYSKWLISNAETLLDTSDLAIGQAGLLRGGAVAWVSVEMEDTLQGPAGVDFRPQMLLTTSFDGSLATTYKMVNTIVVCDNTLSAGLAESGPTFRTKHTRNSGLRIADAREALRIMHTSADAFSAELVQLTETKVTDADWYRFLDAHIPMPEDKGRGRTIAEDKRAKFMTLWNHDVRVAPWRNTAFGVLQADNTYRAHMSVVKNVSRPERNRLSVLDGESAKADRMTLQTLRSVLAVAA